MEFRNKYSSELRDEDIIPFTTEALDVVETVVSFFCDCLNKDNPKFITLTNGNLSPKKEDINLHPSLDGDPTEKICQDTSLCKNATVFQYDKIKNDESNLTEMNKNELNTSFDDCIQNTDNIIDKIEDEFQKKTNYNETLILSSDSEDDDDGAPASVLALRKNIEENINKKIFEEKEDENEKEKENEINKTNSKVSSQESIAKNGSETAPNETDDENKSQSSTADKEKSQQIDEEDSNSLDFPLDEIENHSNKVAKEDTADHTDENEEDLGSDDNFDDDNFNDDNFNDDNFNNDNFNDSANNDGEFNDNLEQVDGSKTSLKEQPCEEGEKEDEVKKNEGESEKEDKDNEGEKDEFNMEQKIMPTPTANLDEIASNFSSQISLEDTYLENAQFLNDSNDEINFIPLQEKDKSNRIRWKYHIKHHSTNKKLRCCNFLIYWSQPSKINPVPKATAEMWMIYYHTSNVGRNDATVTYRFNGYYNTHKINVHKFMKEYAKFKSNSYVQITKEEFPLLYTPLVANPKKWLPELIRSKLLISNDIMNNVLVN